MVDVLTDVREYIDRLHIAGHSIGDDHGDDPILIGRTGGRSTPGGRTTRTTSG